MLSDEMDLGLKEKSPEVVELTPAIEIEGGRFSDVGEVNDEIVASKTPLNSEMSGPEISNSKGEKLSSSNIQTLMNMMQQLLRQELKENQKQSGKRAKEMEERLKENQKQSEEMVVLECQKSKEQLNEELSEKLATVTVEISKVKQEVSKWQGRLEREMIGVKQQFERERKEEDAKLEQLAIHQETENTDKTEDR
jgi:hypothetical protein